MKTKTLKHQIHVPKSPGIPGVTALTRHGAQGEISEPLPQFPPKPCSWGRDGEKQRQDLRGVRMFVVQWLPGPFCFAELYK